MLALKIILTSVLPVAHFSPFSRVARGVRHERFHGRTPLVRSTDQIPA